MSSAAAGGSEWRPSLDEIEEILEVITRLDCREVELSLGQLHLVVRKESRAPNAGRRESGDSGDGNGSRPPSAAVSVPQPEMTTAPAIRVEPDAYPTAAWLAREAAGEVVVVRAPMVGLFYRSNEPGTPPFVEVGDRVADDTIVCLVEVMKSFHSVAAGGRGLVSAIFVQDGSAVEYGQPLLAVVTDLADAEASA